MAGAGLRPGPGARPGGGDPEQAAAVQAEVTAEPADPADPADRADTPDTADFIARFAQVASALHAKSVEDAAFYRYVPLLSLCEVGRDPAEPDTTPAEFHAYCERLGRERPGSGTVLSTHDTKHSADLRLRLAVLTEVPGAWREWLGKLAAPGAEPAPDRHTAYTVFQTGVGLDSGHHDRLVAAALKAVREAGLHTTWTEQDAAYEQAVADFAGRGPGGAQVEQVKDFARGLADYAAANVLGAALLHLTMPGVPDVYQGTEWPVRTLVDPDNREPMNGPVAGVERSGSHDTLRGLLAGRAPGSFDEAKLRLTAVALRLRRDHPEWYGPGAAYDRLAAAGPAAEHCVAFVRGGGALTAVTRLSRRLEDAGGWRDTALTLPPGRWREQLGGGTYEGRVPLAELLADSPVALLTEVTRS